MMRALAPELSDRIFQSLPFGVLLLDRRGRIAACNRRALDLFALVDDDIVGRDVNQVLRTDDPHWFSLDPIDRLGDPDAGRLVEGRIGGRKVTFSVNLAPCTDEAGATQGTLVLLDDSSRRGTDDDRMERLISLGELSAYVAHEIRNPLTGVRTTIQFIGQKLGKDDPKQEDIEAIIAELDRVEKIIEDLLQFSRPQVGTKAMTSLNTLVDRTLEALGPQFEAARVEVNRNLRARLPESLMDPDMIQRVLFNLITNAVEAMPDGGSLKVTTTVRRYRAGEANLEVFISDTGRGIDPEIVERIFQPFFTTRPAGTGLGLPISLQIVRAHGGRITARNRAKGGAIFRLSLPRATATTEEA
ncbi:MAG: ATP-binding protein [Candidatus Eisenbacteria bacterium]|nr:ATP-binding protein [Candidatus Eisenbacteria bacterium]